MAYASPRGAGDTLGTTYLAAGSYPVNLVYYQDRGGGEHGVLRRQGEQLRGRDLLRRQLHSRGRYDRHHRQRRHQHHHYPPGGHQRSPFAGSNVSPLAAAIQTNVQATVNAAIATAGSTSLYSRITFNAANLASLTSLTLRMQYDFGLCRLFERRGDRQQQCPGLAHLELDGPGVSRQPGAGHDLPGHRRLVVLELQHDGPSDGHRQRAGDPDAAGLDGGDRQHHLQRDDRHGHDDLGQRLLHRRSGADRGGHARAV